MVLADHEIKLRHGMITPFQPTQVKTKVITRNQEGPEGGVYLEEAVVPIISYGLSSYGYDARLGAEFKVFNNLSGAVVDPHHFDSQCFVEAASDSHCLIPPNSFALGMTMEMFDIPRDLMVICIGKSTYARCGVVVNVTPLEPEWRGQVTIEISNTSPCPAKVYVGEGIAQFIFLKANAVCEQSYADRKGKYQDQRGIVLPRL